MPNLGCNICNIGLYLSSKYYVQSLVEKLSFATCVMQLHMSHATKNIPYICIAKFWKL
jgi:hypothetical protein